jgi:hypothetical protein
MESFHPNDELVTVTRAPNPAQAHIWENALRDEGIRCQVVGDYLDAGIGDISGIEPEIWVKREDLAQAQEVLQRLSQSSGDTGDEEAPTGAEPSNQP